MTEPTNFDQLIDDVARSITAHEPSPHLRTRILARLDDRRSPRRSWMLVSTAVTAVAAVVVTMVIVNRSGRSLEEKPATVPSTDTARVTPVPPVETVPSAVQVALAGSTVSVGVAADPRAAETAAWREALMPSLPAIAALGIAEIQPDTLAIPQLTVKPLVVAPIDDGSNNQR